MLSCPLPFSFFIPFSSSFSFSSSSSFFFSSVVPLKKEKKRVLNVWISPLALNWVLLTPSVQCDWVFIGGERRPLLCFKTLDRNLFTFFQLWPSNDPFVGFWTDAEFYQWLTLRSLKSIFDRRNLLQHTSVSSNARCVSLFVLVLNVNYYQLYISLMKSTLLFYLTFIPVYVFVHFRYSSAIILSSFQKRIDQSKFSVQWNVTLDWT